jgi:RHS repeat-associated protein
VVPLASAIKAYSGEGSGLPPSGFSNLYAGGICVIDGAGQCIGGDAVKESGIGTAIGYIKDTGGSGTVPVYASTCYSNAGGSCFGRGLSLDVSGSPVGYLSTTAPDTASANAPFTQSNGLLLQGIGGTPSAYLWSPTTGTIAKLDHFYSNDYSQPADYVEEGIIGFLRKDSGSGTVALNRYRNAATGLYYYSAIADQPSGYSFHGTIGYLDSSAGTGLIALYRYYNATSGDYRIDTVSTPPSGYVLQATLGYLQVTNNFTTYIRNPIGQVTSASTLDVTYNYVFDNAHRLTSVNDSRGNKTISYSYSAAGRRLMMQDSDGNRTYYNYDPTGRLTHIWAPNNDTVTFAYDEGGRLKEKWLPNGVNTQYTNNADNTLAQLINRHGSGSIISQHDYSYDGLGNRLTHIENIAGSTTPYKYVYDELNRLTEVRNNNTNALIENYSYGAVGNRISSQSIAFGGATVYYNHDAANQLTDIRTGSSSGPLVAGFVYDENGNLTKKCEGGTVTASSTACSGSTITDLSHDFLDRPVQIAKTGISTQTYKYDDSGRRIQKTAGSAITNYLYDGAQIASQYTDVWTAPTFNYTYGPGADAPTIRANSTTAQYYHQNGIGNVVAVTNQTGATDGTATYNPYGIAITTVGSIPTYGFTGREPDETGLIYYRARYYDPSVGRFTRRDPIGFRGGLNLYDYVGNNPLLFTDPTGTKITVTQNGNIIGITFTVVYYGTGITPAIQQRWDQGIVETWSGPINFGEYQIQTRVTSIIATDAIAQAIKSGDPSVANLSDYHLVHVDAGRTGESSAYQGGMTGNWTPDASGKVAAHEFGHFLGLDDGYQKDPDAGFGYPRRPGYTDNDIMVSSESGQVLSSNISEMLEYQSRFGINDSTTPLYSPGNSSPDSSQGNYSAGGGQNYPGSQLK